MKLHTDIIYVDKLIIATVESDVGTNPNTIEKEKKI